jgi:DNA-binding MarR family transcriptional regulator
VFFEVFENACRFFWKNDEIIGVTLDKGVLYAHHLRSTGFFECIVFVGPGMDADVSGMLSSLPTSPLTLEDQVIVALRRIMRAVDLHSRNLMYECGLTAPQLVALQAIGRFQPVAIGILAKSIHLSQSTLTGIVSRLENRSLVKRTRDGNDRRSVVLALTPQGSKVLETAPSLLQDRFHHELLTLHEWEQTQMLATLQRIAAMMDAEQLEPAPVLATAGTTASSDELKQVADVSPSVAPDEPSSGELDSEFPDVVDPSPVIDLTRATSPVGSEQE